MHLIIIIASVLLADESRNTVVIGGMWTYSVSGTWYTDLVWYQDGKKKDMLFQSESGALDFVSNVLARDSVIIWSKNEAENVSN